MAGEEPARNSRLIFRKDPALREAEDSFRVNNSRKPKPKPKISKPTNISHEPGVRGVIKARKPNTIKIIPSAILKILFILA